MANMEVQPEHTIVTNGPGEPAFSLADWGYHPGEAAPDIARVTAVDKERWSLVSARGEGHGRLKASVYYDGGDMAYPTVGDFVRILYNPGGDSFITETLPRRSYFARSDALGHAAGYVKTMRQQAVAANIDTALLVASLNHDLNDRRMERYLAMTRQSGAAPVIVLTKADLVDDPAPMLARMRSVANGAPVLAISSLRDDGLDALAPYLAPGQTLVLLGSSGAGKSSLLNALAGRDLMRVNAIREDDSKGRHTTTHRELFRLPCGALVIDTPGMRELGMWSADEGLGEAFSDIEALIAQCRFSDCRHESEPGCAVRAALQSGALDPKRWESYQRLKQETAFVADKAAALRNRNARGKSIAMYSRALQKGGGKYGGE